MNGRANTEVVNVSVTNPALPHKLSAAKKPVYVIESCQ
jgi:hypothetical protein